jgi:hypothetical protein
MTSLHDLTGSPEFDFERCADCPGIECQVLVKIMGGFSTIMAISLSERIEQADNTDVSSQSMDFAAGIVRSSKSDPFRFPQTAEDMINRLGCGWSTDHLIGLLLDADLFYAENNPL